MARKGTKKGRVVRVPAEWMQELLAYKKRSGKTLQQLGVELAREMRRPEPVAVSTVHDYLQGRVITEDLTRAFAAVAGLPVPVLAEEPVDEEIREWLQLGRELRAETPDRFRREMDALRELVTALRRHRLR